MHAGFHCSAGDQAMADGQVSMLASQDKRSFYQFAAAVQPVRVTSIHSQHSWLLQDGSYVQQHK